MAIQFFPSRKVECQLVVGQVIADVILYIIAIIILGNFRDAPKIISFLGVNGEEVVPLSAGSSLRYALASGISAALQRALVA